jgi:hypothetical protein
LNKSTKIWLNYITGGAISVLLLWAIYKQVLKQVKDLSADMWQHTGPVGFLVACIVLMFANALLESYKWHSLLSRAEQVSFSTAFSSWLAGVAFSIITPNRIGEYPGRILYLGGSNTFRYINVSVSGITSQLAGIYFWGFVGLIYYNIAFPDTMAQAALGVCVLINIFISVVYWRFDSWVPAMTRNKWLRRFAVYGRLMSRVSAADKLKVLTISLLRVMVFTAQYLFLLRWMNVDVPLLQGFCLAALFFWVMAVIPSLALTELGIRGAVSLYIFAHFSSNTIGILAATTGLWLLNLVIPSVAGSVLITKMKWLR